MKHSSKFLFVFLALSFLLSCARTPQHLISEKSVAPIKDLAPEKIRKSIVLIESQNRFGTGFFVAPDKIATNSHVVAHSDPILVKSPNEETTWTIEGVVAFDTKNNLVILKLTSGGTPLPLGDSGTVQIGGSVFIPGYPDREFEVTEGSIQSIRNSNKWLRVNTTTSKESNGSPVLNNKGQVITVIVPYDIGSSSYAIPSSALEGLLDKSMPIEPLSEWQQRKPVHAAVYYSLGKEKLDLKDYAGAIVDFDKAIELNPEYVRAYYERGRAQGYLGDDTSAIASCTQVIKMDPDEADAYYGRGTIKAKLGDYAAAIIDLDKAIELGAEHANAYSNRGGVKFKLGESEAARENTKEAQRLYEAAIADCDKAIRIDPEHADTYSHRGWVKFKLGESASTRGDVGKAQELYQAAIKDYTHVVKINPENADAYSNRGRVKFKLGGSEVTRANAKEAQNLYKATIDDCDKAIEIDPENADTYSHRGSAQFRLGTFASSRGDVEKAQELYKVAIEDYTQTVQINPENADAYHKRGIVKCKLGDIKSESGDAEIVQRLYHEGITDFDKYIHLTHPDNVNEPVADVESEKIINSIVRVVSWDDHFFAGSGFFVEKDKIVTNIHVVAQTRPAFVTRRNEETIWKVEGVTAFDVENDLVILKITGEGIPLSLGDSDALQSGEPVVAVGYPGGGYKVTAGVMDSTRNSGKLIQMKVVVSGGNSGGPALNSKGHVIGINTAVAKPYAYAISSNVLRALIVQSGSTEPLGEWRKRDHIRAHAYYIKGQQKYKSNRYPAALSHFDVSIQLNPAFVNAYKWRGNINATLGNREEAIADYNTVIRLNPDDAEAYNNRGTVRFSLGESESSRRNAEEAQKLYEAAVEDWTQTIKLTPEYTDVYNNRGVARIALGAFEEAIVDFDKAIQINPQNAKCYYNRARAKEALGQKEEAKADFEKAKELDPDVGK